VPVELDDLDEAHVLKVDLTVPIHPLAGRLV
jgi:hypothetical protein